MRSVPEAVGDAVQPTPVPPRGRGRTRRAGGLLTAAIAVGALFSVPLAFLVVRNLGSDAFWGTLTDAALIRPLLNTLLLAGSVSAAAAALGTASAWLVTRTDLPGRRVWRILLPLPLVIPSFIGAFALIAAFAPGGLLQELLSPLGVVSVPEVRGFWGAFVILTALTYPYVHLPVAARLNQLPASLEEAARLFGRRPAHVFREIVMPQVSSAVMAGTLLVFLYVVSDFGAVELLRYDTLTRAVYTSFQALDLATATALSLDLGLLAVLVVVLERLSTSGPRPSADRTTHGLQVRLGRWRAAAATGMATLVGLALLAPVGVLTFWAVRGLLRGSTRASALVNDLGALVGPTLRTAEVSLLAAVASTVLVLPIAWATVRARSRTAGVANALVVAGFAVPGLAIALALVAWTFGALQPLRDSIPLLVFAYVVHFGAQSLRAAEVAVASVPSRLDDAARALGAGRVRRFLTVDLPLMAPGLLAGAGLVLLSTMKELPATLLLAPPGFRTLATRVWQSTQDAFLADASLASLVLIALSGTLTWVLVVRRSDAL